ncbi:MAG: hypothetical protein OSJ69_12430 [Acetatifactor sp.]|jgi:uncharacterized membrane protein|nr:hypothetical protein [Acetatifactor sp.]
MTDSNAFYNLILPILNMVNGFTGTLLLIVSSLGAIQCIFLGVRFAKADGPEEITQARKNIRDFILGFLLIFILIAAMRAGMPGLCKWMAENTKVTIY